MLGASTGIAVPDIYVVVLLFAGVALAVAVAALSHQHDHAFSASLIYLAFGLGVAGVVAVFDLSWIDPVDDAIVVERLAELAVIIALFSTGLKLDRKLAWSTWSSATRLLAVAMPVTIVALVALGATFLGLSLAAAIVLAAALAPTDPVLAGDLGVGPPGEEDEREPNFAITAEAGLNDGLAFPFLLVGVLVARHDDASWVPEWVLADLLYATVVGVGIGALVGYGLGALASRLRRLNLLAPEYDGWLAIPSVLVLYALAELANGYGFLAAFVGGLAFRRYEHRSELNVRVHEGAEVAERFGELALILLVGSMVTSSGLAQPGWLGWLLVPVLLFVIRPVAVLVALAGSDRSPRERAFLAWFGVRGIGTLYYAAFAVSLGVLTPEDSVEVMWVAIACVLSSVVVHGITATPVARRLLG